jgi:hypothetical protein
MPLPFTLKKYLKAKEELWKLKSFTMQKYNLLEILYKKIIKKKEKKRKEKKRKPKAFKIL